KSPAHRQRSIRAASDGKGHTARIARPTEEGSREWIEEAIPAEKVKGKSGIRESNPSSSLGKAVHSRYANPARERVILLGRSSVRQEQFILPFLCHWLVTVPRKDPEETRPTLSRAA